MSDFQTSVNSGNTLILPENGKIGLLSWSGKGYIDFKVDSSSQSHVVMIIGGGYNGGYGAIAASVAMAPVAAQVNVSLLSQPNDCKVVCNDPVNMATGIWEYNNTDLTLSGGSGGLSLKHSYDSGNNNMKDSLGYGWSHNYRLYVEPHSSSPFGLGQRQPVDAAAIVASVATLDIMNGTPRPEVLDGGSADRQMGNGQPHQQRGGGLPGNGSSHLREAAGRLLCLPSGRHLQAGENRHSLPCRRTLRPHRQLRQQQQRQLHDRRRRQCGSFTYSGGKLQSVSQIETGKRSGGKTLEAIARVLGVPLKVLANKL